LFLYNKTHVFLLLFAFPFGTEEEEEEKEEEEEEEEKKKKEEV
jgi:hypothetical protein